MHEPPDPRAKRTGMGASPSDGQRTVHGDAPPAPPLDGAALAAERPSPRSVEPSGTAPPPATAQRASPPALDRRAGQQPTVFIDKLGERLAFERTGTRLYEAAMAKLEDAGPYPGGPTRADLERIHDAEIRHFMLVRDVLVQLGADPTVRTPSADLIDMAGLGWVQAVSDPRTTLNQCLGILLMAELADQDGWLLLVSLARRLGFDDLAAQCAAAFDEEERHVRVVRGWITTALLDEVGSETAADRDRVAEATAFST